MTKTKLVVASAIVAVAMAAAALWTLDHAKAADATGSSTEIAGLYVFQPKDTANLVFVANLQGQLTPEATKTATFGENTLIEFKIDVNGDYIEDWVIQCVYTTGRMYIYGPVKPVTTGAISTIVGTAAVVVPVTPYGSDAITATSGTGINAFAGPRDDPFFFDMDQFHKIAAGTASVFNNPGTDTFAGTNVLSVVVEVPKKKIRFTGKSMNVWLQTKTK